MTRFRQNIAIKLGVLVLIMLMSACDYRRKQDIPDNVRIKSTEEICSFDFYNVTKYSLGMVDHTKNAEWQEGLICEGYSNRPMNLPWTLYEQLSERHKSNMNYFISTIEACEDAVFEMKKFWVAACQTETVDNGNGELNNTYHAIYCLDRKRAILYEIRDMN